MGWFRTSNDNKIVLLEEKVEELEKAIRYLLEQQQEIVNKTIALDGGISIIADALISSNIVGTQEKNLKTIGGMIDGMNAIHDNMQVVIRVLNKKGILTENDLN